MFGNILGTLQRFKKDDKNLRTSDAVSPPPASYLASRLTIRPRRENSYPRELLLNFEARRTYIPRY
jgi:hypothetical protein